MKAALFEKPHHLAVTERALQRLGPEEVLVKVTACGVCGTDLHIVEGTSRSTPPVVLGHEYAGTILDVGAAVRNFSVGEAVAVDPNIACGTCFYCRRGDVHLCDNLRALGVDIDGGMAESCIVPVAQLFRIPGSMKAEEAAFIEPLSCAIHGIDRARVHAGDTVAILGGGTVGLLLLQLAKLSGASNVVVVEPLEWKRQTASNVGADAVVDPKATNPVEFVRDTTGVGADVVIECVGRPETVDLALKLARRGGTVELFGVCPVGVTVPVEPNAVYFKELTIVGSYVNPHTFARSIVLLSSGKVSVRNFEMKRFPLDGVHDALETLRKGNTIKSLIVPS